ncbi:MAG TPA: nucleotidyltransferase family protein [Anaerolinea sp.]|nr:nucleotidyltransferase family protein [Anaerolinea sp.]
MVNEPLEAGVGAVVLAAGQSRRMGTAKMVLPWGSRTVIAQVVEVLADSGVKPVVVVTGGAQEAVQQCLANYNVTFAHNHRFAETEMLDSLRIGLHALPSRTQAALVTLGDQPQILPGTVRAVLSRYQTSHNPIIVPSYQMRRGHPWLLGSALWEEIFNLEAGKSLRDFLAAYAEDIDYLVVDTPTILGDLDTPEDYDRLKP